MYVSNYFEINNSKLKKSSMVVFSPGPGEPKDYPKGSQDQDIFRYLEPDFYPHLRVDYDNQMAYRS